MTRSLTLYCEVIDTADNPRMMVKMMVVMVE